jgi:hypothetical protein
VAFIVQKAFKAQILRMRSLFFTFCASFVVLAAGISPDIAFARETDQTENASCGCVKQRRTIVRPLTEPAPIRKKDRDRVRRILM